MENIRSFLTSETSSEVMYKLMVSTIIPRPIAFVSTINNQGQCNLAPYSFFNGVSSLPATLVISVARKTNNELKDTHINIIQTKQFVVNNVHNSMWQNMVDAAATYPYGVSEFKEAGFTEQKSIIVQAPRVKESSVSFECSLYDSLDIKDKDEISATLFVGKIEAIHISSNLISDNNRIDPKLINAVGRLGGVSYCTLGDIMSKPVPILK